MIPVLPLVNSFGPKISLKEPSDKRAAKVVPQVVQSAVAGNLLAIAVLASRSTYGISAERAVWQNGYNQVASSRPDLVQQYQARKASLQVPGFPDPETAAQWATANVITASSTSPGVVPPGTPTNPPPIGDAGAPTATSSAKMWGILALLAGGGALLFLALRRK